MSFLTLSLPLQNTRLFDHVNKCLKSVCLFFQRAFQRGIGQAVCVWHTGQGWIEEFGVFCNMSRDSGANDFHPTSCHHERRSCLISIGRAQNLSLLTGGSSWATNLGMERPRQMVAGRGAPSLF